MISEIAKKAEELGCTVIHKASLKDYTTFKIGGSCDLLIKINGQKAAETLIPFAHKFKIPYYIFGNGSNLIVDDLGLRGVVFLFGEDFSGVWIHSTNLDEIVCDCKTALITCEAGTPLSKLSRFALDNQMTGFEFLYGIPGTVGGAVYMNAGAYGGEIKDVILTAQAIDEEGNTHFYVNGAADSVKSRPANDLELSYRSSVFMRNHHVIQAAVFKAEKGVYYEIKAKMDEIIEKRRGKQPLEYPSAGSTFKRPEGSYAALLIEQCGLKGLSVGGAEVSQKHSGFIINKNGASFNDLMALIEKVKEAVFEKTGIMLECEPEILSDREYIAFKEHGA
ncbi:MAG: UDP-N-acetylmuramate dehydrogenase [Oscillospiraceae bacterium]|nr:UDP-N-acetylmuramate dehydrogenase [Oscillospiraceae bacterium]